MNINTSLIELTITRFELSITRFISWLQTFVSLSVTILTFIQTILPIFLTIEADIFTHTPSPMDTWPTKQNDGKLFLQPPTHSNWQSCPYTVECKQKSHNIFYAHSTTPFLHFPERMQYYP